ncbi:MAG: hypothetical protein D6798_13915 [Deltaproteobacteria bacterium]|nr:MAG: hypothetical protein D6798_13915 [Deltaproteobacteria bacterium]
MRPSDRAPSVPASSDRPDRVVVGSDDRVLYLAKPPGIPVFPPHGDPRGDCLLARLLATCPPQQAPAWPEGFAGGIAHRLDVATSGLVLAATSPDSLAWLRGLFADKLLEKRYLFLTRRQVPWDRHVVELPLAHDRRRKARMVARRGQRTPHRGRWLDARTELRRVGRVGELWLWEARMRTGVMHQVRLHAAMAGLALAGDRLYGGGEPTAPARALARARGLPAAPFHLHHVGLSGPGLVTPVLAPPPWWGREVADLLAESRP